MSRLSEYLVVGPPLPQRLKIPKKYRADVAWLLAHPENETYNFARYLRYNLVVNGYWAIADARDIAEGTYPWENDGFSSDDEGNTEGPDCLIQDFDWNLLDPRGQPTLDLDRVAEAWTADSECFQGDEPMQRDRQMKVKIVVAARGRANLFDVLAEIEDLGWGLNVSRPRKRARAIVVTHDYYSGEIHVSGADPKVLLCQVKPTNRHDPERLIALFTGAMHRWFQDKAESISLEYVP